MAKVKFQAVFLRREVKYLLSKEQFDRIYGVLQGMLRPSPFGLHTTILSLYFDTDTWNIARLSADKPKYKEKFRLRSYGTVTGDQPVFAELKKKAAGTVFKRRLSLPCCEAEELCQGRMPPSFCTGLVGEGAAVGNGGGAAEAHGTGIAGPEVLRRRDGRAGTENGRPEALGRRDDCAEVEHIAGGQHIAGVDGQNQPGPAGTAGKSAAFLHTPGPEGVRRAAAGEQKTAQETAAARENRQIAREIDWFFRRWQPRPAMMLAYDRMALQEGALSAEQEEGLRVTFDFNIRWRLEQHAAFDCADGQPLFEPGQHCLMEVKTPGAIPVFLARLLSEVGAYPTSYSKYGRACMRLHPAAPPHEIDFSAGSASGPLHQTVCGGFDHAR